MKSSDFVFHYVKFLYYIWHKINLKRYGLYIDFLDWIKKGKVLINPVNKDGKFLEYIETVALNHKNGKKMLEEYQKLNIS